MTDGSVSIVATYWMRKAEEALASAADELTAGRHTFATNRCYYAAFYAATAVLLAMGRHFAKHAGVRGAVHQHLVAPGLLDAELGRAYDRLAHDRQEGDYVELTDFSRDEVLASLADAAALVRRLQELLTTPSRPPG